MKTFALIATAVLLPMPAFAGVAPGPEMGDGLTGLAVLAVLAAGYIVLRRVRTARAR